MSLPTDTTAASVPPPEPSTANDLEMGKPEDETNPFSQYYGQLLHQQNMMQDAVRTGTYERAILENSADFQGKVVLDVGTGSGILAFFAAKAGARKVYAAELSSAMAANAKRLVHANGLSNVIEVIQGKVEEQELPEKVDIVISEPMGFFLVHERMLESYVAAGRKFRNPEAPAFRMFPSVGTMYVCPFTDDVLYKEQLGKVAFWEQNNFYDIDLSSLREQAVADHFAQPVVGYFNPDQLISATTATHKIDFASINDDELTTFDIPFRFQIDKTALLHGFGCWFDVAFNGSVSQVVLSTGPHAPGTHWYQCRMLLPNPLAVNRGQMIHGVMKFKANAKFSYDIDLEVQLEGTDIVSRNHIRLQDQMYHYLYSPVSYQQ